jgi:glycosyltransferase involved in cell wall biosynthesis
MPEHAVVLTFVGQVRAYKGVPELARAFREVTHRDARLVIAGEARDTTEVALLRDAARRDPRLVLALERHSPEALGALVQASDAVVLPYRSVLNSGTAVLALSYGRPVVVPDTPVFAELASVVGPGWVHAVPVPLTVATLSELIDDLAARPPDGAPDLERLEWPPIADAMMRFLAQLDRE